MRPRQDSNLRTRLRRPMLYPLSYEGEGGNSRIPARNRCGLGGTVAGWGNANDRGGIPQPQ